MFDTERTYGNQFRWIIGGIIIAIVILLVDGSFINSSAYLIYGVTTFLLAAVLIIGVEVNGATSWFRFGPVSLQPSEFAKLGLSLALAKYLSSLNIRIQDFNTKVFAALLIAVPSGFILLQPDTGTVLVFVSFIFVLYREGLSGDILLLGLLTGVLAVTSLLVKDMSVSIADVAIFGNIMLSGILILLASFIYILIKGFTRKRYRKRAFTYLAIALVVSIVFVSSVDYIFSKLSPHQQDRIEVLLGKKYDPQGLGYNVKQSKTAIGSGGFTGKGYLKGTLTKHKYVPMQSTDFIFCTIGEEFGFIGSFLLIGLFLTLMIRIIFVAERQRSKLTRIFGYCVACIFFFHFTINIGMTIGLAPVIGIPLPFFSYGGSSLWAFTALLFIFIKLDSERMDILR